MKQRPEVSIYTDGGARGNPGPGGYGVVLEGSGKYKELCAAYALTTNNRMELRALLAAFAALKAPCRIEFYSDSRYVIDALSKGWLEGWKRRSWRKANKEPVLNQDLWKQVEALIAPHEVRWHWVKGHAGNALNERCDQLVHEAIDAALASGEPLPEDEGYASAS